MLLGAAFVLVFLTVLVVTQVAKKPDLVLGQLEPRLAPVADGLDLLSPTARALVEEMRGLGFELQGIFRPAPKVDPKEGAPPPPLRIVTLMAIFLAADRKTEGIVYSTSIVYERKSARSSSASDYTAFLSYGPAGEIVKTYNHRAFDALGWHPTNSWRRLPGVTSLRALLAAHEKHVRERPFEPATLDPAEHERRFSIRHCEELWYLESKGLVRFDGPIVRGTRLLRLKTLVRMIGPGTNEERPLRAFALHALLGGAGAYAAQQMAWSSFNFPGVCELFVILATLALVLFRRSMLGSAFYVCMPAAVVLELRGFHDGSPWFVVALVAIFGQLVAQRLRYRREKARQERTLAEIRTRAPRASSG